MFVEITTPDENRPNSTVAKVQLHTPIVELLHACYGSRKEALETYVSVFDMTKETGGPRGAIYVNPGIDTLAVSFSLDSNAIHIDSWAQTA